MIKQFAVAAVFAFTASHLNAATPGSDNAADPIYGGSGAGSFDGKDGGTPSTFGPWTVTTNPLNISDRAFVGDSTTSAPGNSGGDINSSGVSFGLFGFSRAQAARSFDSPLSIGQTFSIQLAVNNMFGLLDKGLDVRDANGNVLFNLAISSADIEVMAPPGILYIPTLGGFNPNTVLTVQLTQTSATGGIWTVVRSGGLSGTQSSTINYNGDPASFDVYASFGGGTMFFNNIQIVPEPSTLALIVGPGLLGASRYVRRRRGT